MFVKPIDRDIKGVIKVGQRDEDNIYQELDEYVVTKELSKHFREFFESYKKGINSHTDEMGVWISGFFGSGKSHFLKILSYILENKEVNDRKAIDFFSEDKKINDPLVIADMTLAANTSADVILFNIDSKSASSQTNKDAIIDVFLRVFNEMQGFCGESPFLADLERKLTKKGLFEEFKRKFAEINGEDWLNMRDDFYFVSDDIIETLSKIGYMSEEAARNWTEKAEENYTISIEKFAKLVQEYCENKGNNHHVVFLVDEIGQYIGDDSKLMLNLQTVTEDLGIMCGGKAWIIVTSQQDIDSIMKVKGNDFSKIQGRFKTRLSLSSANVDEVIRKRILAKNKTAIQTLELLYGQKEAILKNLITFTSDTAEKKMYTNSKDFAEVYPFIPYQFNLLGKVLTSIRTHGASGKHLAEGERSMLALFQESASSFKDKDLGILVPFNVFYDSLHKFIDHTHSSVIIQAGENQILEDFDVELLKVLFMVKYVKEIKANIENLTTLMVSDIDEDVVDLRKKIEKSLKRLENQTLIQKNGEIYSFLTNEEQDINRAINQENVEIGEIINEASNVIFEEIFTDKKYRKSARYNFPFNQVVDNRNRGKTTADMGVRVITPYYEFNNSSDDNQMVISPQSESERTATILKGMSEDNNEIIIHLGNDTSFLEEITGLLKISKYLTKQSAELSVSSKSILHAKQEEISEKRERIRIFLEEALRHADIYVKGDKVNIKEKDPANRIDDALSKLVTKIYHKLHYMETDPSAADIASVINSAKQSEFGNSNNVKNNLAIKDMQQFIDYETRSHNKVSLKTVVNRFKQAPYGFVDLDIEWLIATLFRLGDISLTINSQNLSIKKNNSQDIVRYLTRKEFQEKLLIDRKEVIDSRKIKDVKEVLKELLAIPNIPEDEETLMDTFKNRSNHKLNDINQLLTQYEIESRYPGKNVILNSKELLQEVNYIDSPTEFFNYVSKHKDDFLDIREDLRDIIDFFKNQKNFFKTACELEDLYNKDKNYIEDPNLIETAENLKKIIIMPNPYSNIPKLPELCSKFIEMHQAILENKARPIKQEIGDDLGHILEELDSSELKQEFESKFTARFEELNNKLINCREISAIPGIQNENEILMTRCMDEIEAFNKKLAEIQTPEDVNVPAGPKIIKKNLTIKSISSKPRITIKKEEDIDNFLEELRKKLKDELGEDTVINLKI